MPTYEYECRECGNRFEVFQNMSDEPLDKCEECGGAVKRLIFGGTGVIFKGSGFYVTDTKGKSSTSSTVSKSDSSTSEASSDSKTEKKTETSAKKTETSKPASRDSKNKKQPASV